ncbi:YggS family pyridoxal phosphate-dependent enzyme [Neokomagataea thailandica]|uniref:Pyridoxal phosphate homeostasis protein n=1 Tax=Neokomagataea tanensis NBRC 106556 TaxID=1223519 RepID=A0ABQ0QJG1_9PROT|nr:MULTISPECIES: YggS family pyridoxal phosphate-dependent enzyme [Neokomagataea]GBR47009.1 hypothetical protein AA106556_1308 [Neokomagataea tanensis NBRC 106556]
MSDIIACNLDKIRNRIRNACAEAGRAADATHLVAVSKFHPLESIEAALAAGQRLFGENRVQEAATKFPVLRSRYPDLLLHIIGGLQTNKALEACRIADVIETLDRPSLLTAIDKATQKTGRLPRLYVQINTGNEPQKFGTPREQADKFIEQALQTFGPAVKGLMCIPPENEEPHTHFQLLAQLAHRHGLKTLSMGMSADFEAAIAHGATHVRVGSAIFGGRPTPPTKE